MANNRLYIKCKSCGEELCIGKHFGYCYFTPSDDTDKRLNDFYKKHAFCQKDQDGFADRGDFEITYEIEPNGHMSDLISRADAICEVLVNDGIENIVDRINALPSADAEFADLPDIPRAYYERIVGNMAHEINMLKEQLESADAVQGEWKHTITWQPYCSNCEYVFGEDEEFSPFWNYCPMCGAKMKGGAE